MSKFMTAVKNRIKRQPLLLHLAAQLVHWLEHLRHPATQWQLWRDFLQTRRALAPVIKAQALPAGAEPERTALILSHSAFIYQIKIEAMLALGLRAQGWHVVVLTSRRFPWAYRYFRAFGVTAFTQWEEVLLTDAERREASAAAVQILKAGTTFAQVKEWRYQEAWIGPQILSSLARMQYQGIPDLESPLHRDRLCQFLTEAVETAMRATKMYRGLLPDLILINEANYLMNGTLVDVAVNAGINLVQFIQPARDDALYFKRLTRATRREHPASVSRATFEKLRALPWTKRHEERLAAEFENRYSGKWFLQSRNQPGVRRKKRDELIAQLGIDTHKKVAVVFSHVLWDATLFYGNDLFDGYGDWFVQTVRAACANPAVNWVIKMHPANLWKRAREGQGGELAEVALIRTHVGDLPGHVRLLYPDTDINTLSLVEVMDYAVTVRGTIGLELPCLGVPVLTAGTGRYSGLGFTVDSTTRAEYLERLQRIQQQPPLSAEQVLLAKRHAYALFCLRPWAMRSFRATFSYRRQGTHPLDHNLSLHAASQQAIADNADLRAWADWAQDVKNVDYLHADADSDAHLSGAGKSKAWSA